MSAASCVNERNQRLRRLIAADVEFVIVGGFGAVVHGSILATRNLDVCAVLTPANIDASSVVVEVFGHRVRVIGLEDLTNAKEFLGRDKDILAAKERRAILEKSRG
jgi:hypothetical protein